MGFIVNDNQPLTVLQVIPRLVSGGAERSAVDVAEALIKNGHNAIIISEGGRLVDELRRIGAVHIQLPVASKSPWRIYRNIGKIGKIIQDHKVDIIHSRSRAPAWSFIMPPSAVAKRSRWFQPIMGCMEKRISSRKSIIRSWYVVMLLLVCLTLFQSS